MSARPTSQENLIKHDSGSRSHVSCWILAQESPTLGAGLHLIMEKSSRRWRSCLVSVCGTRLVNNRLSETCAHHCLSGQNLRGVQASRKRDISLNYWQAHSRVWSSGTKLLNRGGFHNCPHSVQHQPGRGRI